MKGKSLLTRLQKLVLGCLGLLVLTVFCFFVWVVWFWEASEGLNTQDLFGAREQPLLAQLEASLGLLTRTPTVTPTSSQTSTATTTSTLTPTSTAMPTATPTHTRTPTLTYTPTPPPTPTFTRVLPPPTATPLYSPTPTPMPPVTVVYQEYRPLPPQSPIVAGPPYAAAEQTTVDLINEERRKANLPRLERHFALDRIAQERSRDMATRAYFSHEDPDGGMLPLERLLIANDIQYGLAGENIAYFLGPKVIDELPRRSVDNWMNSPGHRDNIMEIEYNATGFGIASAETEEGTVWYLTQIFAAFGN